MEVVVGVPILTFLVMFESAIVGRIFLLQGNADIVLLGILAWSLQDRTHTGIHWAVIGGLLVNVISGLPYFAPLIGYCLAVFVALLLKRRVWQVPFFAMSIATFFGTLISLGMSWGALTIRGHPLPFIQSMTLIILPSLLLNMLFALPIFILIGGLAEQIHPEEFIKT